ncbi:MAG: GNAT family protein [Sphingobium sp.]|uniref:GNAT family N-acetyltransferase n=1 Tax=Sphingobium sp. TaxID=1912891 RepID=UPI0029A210D2|nr:GNAT family protein [Sphingobium sp.]MDX3910471.1 GNAT family protein [Sphingobium sp.]
MVNMDGLLASIAAGDIVMTQLAERDREDLRAICPDDDAVWEIYPVRLASDDFDREFEAIVGNPARNPFAVRVGGVLTGISGYLNIDAASGVLEIGGTYMTPAVRGTGLNGRIKPLLLGRAFGCGFQRAEFRIDTRNGRSLRAVEKLGAVREGVLRRQRRTWTGYLRDTVVLSILREEWQE